MYSNRQQCIYPAMLDVYDCVKHSDGISNVLYGNHLWIHIIEGPDTKSLDREDRYDPSRIQTVLFGRISRG